MPIPRKILLAPLVALSAVCGYFAYMAWAFPDMRCEGIHLVAPDAMRGDCYGCHRKATPRIAQEWFESKHGVMLVRCQTCHGLPDGSGSIPFSVSPGKDICVRCHSAAMEKMEAKFGRRDGCTSCHPYHQSPMHGDAYTYRQPSGLTDFDARGKPVTR